MLYKVLPYGIFKRLFGDRKQFGLQTKADDADFVAWQENNHRFYQDNQKKSVGKIINHFSFKIMRSVDLQDKVVLEVGPGILEHLQYNHTRPHEYILADIDAGFLDRSEKQLQNYGINNIRKILVKGIDIPLESDSVDIIVSFHQLEHIYLLDEYIKELHRILKPSGLLIGAVPCEGGLAWGLGRCLTSRRYVKKHMNFNYDKIICWEHPNFVNKIHRLLSNQFACVKSVRRPLPFLFFDLNLSWSFIYQKVVS